jgi:hypothetical protein
MTKLALLSRDGTGSPPRHRPDRDAAAAVERDEVRLGVGAEPGAQVVGLEPPDDRLLAVGDGGLRDSVSQGERVAGQYARQHGPQPRPG